MAELFIHTIGDASQLPDAFNGRFLKGRGEPRIALVGRSNVGKSSLINALVGAKVAQVSNEPGKTRCIHFYSWPKTKRIIADLPGYGYARASKDERERWSKFIGAYFKEDPCLEGVLILIDSRHGPTELDCDAIRFFSGEKIPLLFVMTKSDQLKTQSERARRRKEAGQAIDELGFDTGGIFWVSAKSGDGLKALAARLVQG